ncbi:hypothetical protein [Leptospira idonii]|uniref:Uncharacterized protein n=1 Tax=Leptospira idonii TaxID=1193500 RepID=A0A4R9M0C7_9LEPT|nr:hypothetical protein [Leptospira idonii]TGN20110.1 hypothetical protein EHS15_05285 [Leptospira idonii]
MKKISLLFLVFFTITSLWAQESGASDKGKEPHDEIDKLDQGSNLERRNYQLISESYRDRIVSGLRMLTIISSNFGEDVPESKAGLEKIKKDYQAALRYYYRRAYVVSGKAMVQVDKDLNDLLSKFSKAYDTKTQTLLAECADAISAQEEKQLVSDSKEGGSAIAYHSIPESQHKLKIAYYQLSMATDMIRGRRYYDSIVHFRIAKDYGIRILVDLKDAEADKKGISDKYAKDLSDNRNLIHAGAAAAAN